MFASCKKEGFCGPLFDVENYMKMGSALAGEGAAFGVL